MVKIKNYINEKIDTAKDYAQRIGDSALHVAGGAFLGGVAGMGTSGMAVIGCVPWDYSGFENVFMSAVTTFSLAGIGVGLTASALAYNVSKSKGDKI